MRETNEGALLILLATMDQPHYDQHRQHSMKGSLVQALMTPG